MRGRGGLSQLLASFRLLRRLLMPRTACPSDTWRRCCLLLNLLWRVQACMLCHSRLSQLLACFWLSQRLLIPRTACQCNTWRGCCLLLKLLWRVQAGMLCHRPL